MVLQVFTLHDGLALIKTSMLPLSALKMSLAINLLMLILFVCYHCAYLVAKYIVLKERSMGV